MSPSTKRQKPWLKRTRKITKEKAKLEKCRVAVDELRETGASSVSRAVEKKEKEVAKVHATLLSRIAELYDYRETYELQMAEAQKTLDTDERARIDLFRSVLGSYFCAIEEGPRLEKVATHCKVMLSSIDPEDDLAIFASQHGTGQPLFMPDTEGAFVFPAAFQEELPGPPIGDEAATRTVPPPIPPPPAAPPIPAIGEPLQLVFDATGGPSGQSKLRHLTNSEPVGKSTGKKKVGLGGGVVVGSAAGCGDDGESKGDGPPPDRPVSRHVVFNEEYQALYEHVGGVTEEDFNHVRTAEELLELFPPGTRAFALYDYEAQNADELSFMFDDALTVQVEKKATELGWLTVRNDAGKLGIVPANYFEAEDADPLDGMERPVSYLEGTADRSNSC
jgi:hypothetical protein